MAWQQKENVWTREDGVKVTLNPNSQASFVRKADDVLILGANGAPRPFRSVDEAMSFADQALPAAVAKRGWGLGLGR